MKDDLWWTIILDYRLHVSVDCWKENGDDECKCQGFVGNLLDDLSIYDVWHGSCISLSQKRHRAHAESIHCFITVVGSFLESPACNAPKTQAKKWSGTTYEIFRTYKLQSAIPNLASGVHCLSYLTKAIAPTRPLRVPWTDPQFPHKLQSGQAAKPLKWTKPGLCRRQRSPTILPYLPGVSYPHRRETLASDERQMTRYNLVLYE